MKKNVATNLDEVLQKLEVHSSNDSGYSVMVPPEVIKILVDGVRSLKNHNKELADQNHKCIHNLNECTLEKRRILRSNENELECQLEGIEESAQLYGMGDTISMKAIMMLIEIVRELLGMEERPGDTNACKS